MYVKYFITSIKDHFHECLHVFTSFKSLSIYFTIYVQKIRIFFYHCFIETTNTTKKKIQTRRNKIDFQQIAKQIFLLRIYKIIQVAIL